MPARKCNTATLLGLFVFVLVIGYSFITIQDSQKSINLKSHEIVKRRDHENVLKEQLKVVYHHAQRVEDELKKERERHKKTRQDFLGAKKDFIRNLTNSKHEAWTRFKALDSDHKMLKAEHEETKISYTSLQAQYKRLSNDHQHIVKQSKSDYISLKELKDRESLSLQDRVQELYKKAGYYQQLAEQQETYSKKIKEHYENCTKQSAQYKEKLKSYNLQKKSMSMVLEKNKPAHNPNLDVLPSSKQITGKSFERVTRSTTVKSFNNNNNNNNDIDDDDNTDAKKARSLNNNKNVAFDQVGNHRYAGKAANGKEAAVYSNDRYGSLGNDGGNANGDGEGRHINNHPIFSSIAKELPAVISKKPISHPVGDGGEATDDPNNRIDGGDGGGAKNRNMKNAKQLELPLVRGADAVDMNSIKDTVLTTITPYKDQQQQQEQQQVARQIVPPKHPKVSRKSSEDGDVFHRKKMMLEAGGALKDYRGNQGENQDEIKQDVSVRKDGSVKKDQQAIVQDLGAGNIDNNNNTKERRLDVKKVTLEDDELGDQNLDNKVGGVGNEDNNGDGGDEDENNKEMLKDGGGAYEEGDEEDGMEAKFPNMIHNNNVAPKV